MYKCGTQIFFQFPVFWIEVRLALNAMWENLCISFRLLILSYIFSDRFMKWNIVWLRSIITKPIFILTFSLEVPSQTAVFSPIDPWIFLSLETCSFTPSQLLHVCLIPIMGIHWNIYREYDKVYPLFAIC